MKQWNFFKATSFVDHILVTAVAGGNSNLIIFACTHAGRGKKIKTTNRLFLVKENRHFFNARMKINLTLIGTSLGNFLRHLRCVHAYMRTCDAYECIACLYFVISPALYNFQ